MTTLLTIMRYMSRPTRAVVKDIDIADIFGEKYRYCIDIGNDDIDAPLVIVTATKSNED